MIRRFLLQTSHTQPAFRVHFVKRFCKWLSRMRNKSTPEDAFTYHIWWAPLWDWEMTWTPRGWIPSLWRWQQRCLCFEPRSDRSLSLSSMALDPYLHGRIILFAVSSTRNFLCFFPCFSPLHPCPSKAMKKQSCKVPPSSTLLNIQSIPWACIVTVRIQVDLHGLRKDCNKRIFSFSFAAEAERNSS